MNRIDKLFTLTDADRCKRLYEWIKTGVITLNEFREIMERFAHNNYVDGHKRASEGGMN